jgi:hypothetical protein
MQLYEKYHVSMAFGWSVINDNHENANMQMALVRINLLLFNYAQRASSKEKKFENVEMGIESVSLIQFQQIFFKLNLWALKTQWDYQQISRLKQMAVRSHCARRVCAKTVTREGIAYKKTKSFLQLPSCSEGSRVASRGRGWPQGVRSRLGGYGWPCGFADGLGGFRWPREVMSGHRESRVASALGGPR